MKSRILGFAVTLLVTPVALSGCTSATTEKPTKPAPAKATSVEAEEAKIRAKLEALAPADRKLAEAQKWCAVEDENRLGDMGTPIKVMIEDQPVFLCCKSCRKRALEHPEQVLAKVVELKKKAVAARP